MLSDAESSQQSVLMTEIDKATFQKSAQFCYNRWTTNKTLDKMLELNRQIYIGYKKYIKKISCPGCCRSYRTPSPALVYHSRGVSVRPRSRNVTASSFLLRWRTFSWSERYSSNNGWFWPRNYSISPTPSRSSTSSAPSYFSSVWWTSSSGTIFSMRNVSISRGDHYDEGGHFF